MKDVIMTIEFIIKDICANNVVLAAFLFGCAGILALSVIEELIGAVVILFKKKKLVKDLEAHLSKEEG